MKLTPDLGQGEKLSTFKMRKLFFSVDMVITLANKLQCSSGFTSQLCNSECVNVSKERHSANHNSGMDG